MAARSGCSCRGWCLAEQRGGCSGVATVGLLCQDLHFLEAGARLAHPAPLRDSESRQKEAVAVATVALVPVATSRGSHKRERYHCYICCWPDPALHCTLQGLLAPAEAWVWEVWRSRVQEWVLCRQFPVGDISTAGAGAGDSSLTAQGQAVPASRGSSSFQGLPFSIADWAELEQGASLGTEP